MVITPHAIAGALIATNFERLHILNPKRWSRVLTITAVLAAAFCSHFLLDFIPHYEYWIYGPRKDETIIKILFDLAAALTIIGFVLKYQFRNLTAHLDSGSSDQPKSKEWVGDLPFLGLVSVGVATSLGPDVLVFFSRTWEIFFGYRAFHDFFHSSKNPGLLGGTLIQILVSIVLTIWCRQSYKKLCEEKRVNFLAEKFINGDMCVNLDKK